MIDPPEDERPKIINLAFGSVEADIFWESAPFLPRVELGRPAPQGSTQICASNDNM